MIENIKNDIKAISRLNNNNYDFFKKIEKLALKKFLKMDVCEWETSLYSPSDFLISRKSSCLAGEYKTRFSRDLSGHMMEMKKVGSIDAQIKSCGFMRELSKVLYVNYYILEDKIYVWDLDDVIKNGKYKIEKRRNKKYQTKDKSFYGENVEIEREVYFFDEKDCIIKGDFSIIDDEFIEYIKNYNL